MPISKFFVLCSMLSLALSAAAALPQPALADEDLMAAATSVAPAVTDSGAAAEPNAAPNGTLTDNGSPVAAPTNARSNAPQPQSRTKVGFDLGWYFPTDAVVENRFGSDWFTIGVGAGTLGAITKQTRFVVDLDVEADQKGDNRAILIPLGLEMETGLSNGRTVPYVGVSGDFISTVIQSPQDNVKSAYRAGIGASAFAGLNFQDNVNIEARYRVMDKIAGYNLDGAEVTAGVRF